MNARARLVVAAVCVATLAAGYWAYSTRTRTVQTQSGIDLGPVAGNARPEDFNVIVLTLDTTRSDRIGAYGDHTAATPNLDRLASEGVLFGQAIAPVPLTLPAHSTLFTGLLPPKHGVRDNGGYVLDPKHRTLASVLKAGGFQTAAFVGAFVLDSKWGLNQGFDTYFDRFDVSKYQQVSLGGVARRATEVVDNAMPWLEQHARQRFFAWLHFYDAHTPYDPPEPFRSRFADRRYAGEIAYVDHEIGRVLRWLDTKQLSDRTIVVAIGDHGESLNEHGEATPCGFRSSSGHRTSP
jgi:arylsulfatase A-like enzyme